MSRSEYKRWNNESELLDGRSVGKHHQWKPISRRSDPVSRAGSRWGGVGGINPQFQKKKDGAWALSVFFPERELQAAPVSESGVPVSLTG
jgi:hypothetical protein